MTDLLPLAATSAADKIFGNWSHRRAGVSDIEWNDGSGTRGNTEVAACARALVTDPVVLQNLERADGLSSFHRQALAARVVQNQYTISRKGRVRAGQNQTHAQQMWARRPRTLAYDYVEANPVIEVKPGGLTAYRVALQQFAAVGPEVDAAQDDWRPSWAGGCNRPEVDWTEVRYHMLENGSSR